MHGRYEKCIKILIRKLEGKRTLGRFRCRFKDNIKMNLKEMGCEHRGWFPLAWNGLQ
jgi:hypothetical protein